jgi:hypothetical protein
MPDALINLVEFAKGHDDPIASGMIEQFARESDVLSTIPFKNVTQGMNRFDRETSEPTVAFRGLNAEPEISHGSEETLQDICSPISGLIEFDRIKLKRYGERKRALYMMGQMKNGSRLWTDTFISGDNSTDPKEWDGMQRRCVADATGSVDGSNDDSRLVANSVASGGGALSLSNIDLIESLVNGMSHLVMSRKMKMRFKAAARDPNLTNNRITDDMDSNLGRRVTRFGDAIILCGYEVSKDSQLLPFNEVAHGGGSAVTSSVYGMSFREDGVCGIQTSEPEYVPVDTDRGVFERDLFEWDCGITIEDFYSAIRLSSITDAPIVA